MEIPSIKNITRYSGRLLAILLGLGAGYAYYYFIGCVSGSCPITSNPWISTAYGGMIGWVFSRGLRSG